MDIKKSTMGIIMLIIFLVIALTIVGTTIDDVQDAGDTVNECPTAFPTYNSSSDLCLNSTGGESATSGSPPLANLFDGNGALILILMAMVFIGLMVTVFKYKNK